MTDLAIEENVEYFDIVDEAGRVVGKAPRGRCHGDPSLIHRTVHVVVFHPDNGSMLLQKRRLDKDIQPGKWDTAVGGHLASGEDHATAVLRELREELGVDAEIAELSRVMDTEIRNEIESENVRVYSLFHPGPFDFQREEISEVRFWSARELREAIESEPEIFTPNFIDEFKRLECLPDLVKG